MSKYRSVRNWRCCNADIGVEDESGIAFCTKCNKIYGRVEDLI
tara:strand:+ start:92 stop:220 length:129 start_codon:yes stop_codon:yes gene_type:complete